MKNVKNQIDEFLKSVLINNKFVYSGIITWRPDSEEEFKAHAIFYALGSARILMIRTELKPNLNNPGLIKYL